MQITINAPDNLPKSVIQQQIKEFENKLQQLQHNVKEKVFQNDDFKIDPKMCLKTLDKIKKGDLSGFTEIEDIEAHVQGLQDEIN